MVTTGVLVGIGLIVFGLGVVVTMIGLGVVATGRSVVVVVVVDDGLAVVVVGVLVVGVLVGTVVPGLMVVDCGGDVVMRFPLFGSQGFIGGTMTGGVIDLPGFVFPAGYPGGSLSGGRELGLRVVVTMIG